MFDKDGSGTVSFKEFCALWKYVTDWLNCFKSFDQDEDGSIDKNELKTAFATFGMHFNLILCYLIYFSKIYKLMVVFFVHVYF